MAAGALLLSTPPSRALDRTTRLDVVAVAQARDLAIRALTGTAYAGANDFESLSLIPREVSERAETIFVGRALRLERLLRNDAPGMMIENEIDVLCEEKKRLDSLELTPYSGDDRYVPDDDIERFSDRRFALSLGTFTAVIDAVADFHREERPADGSEVFALGGPLVEPAIDFENPPSDLFERAIQEHGVWDAQAERERWESTHRAWLEWMVLEGTESIPAVREMIGVLRADLLEVPHDLREQFVERFDCSLAPVITCEDWIPLLDERLVAFESDLSSALEEGLVILSRVKRSLAY